MRYSIHALNQMSVEQFVEFLGDVFEHTPRIARQAWEARPFATCADLHQRMADIVHAMTDAEQLALIQAHPDLGIKARMADASVQEQAGAGLDRLSPDEYQHFQSLNQAYKQTFGFPFIVAVKNHTKATILDAFNQRLKNNIATEKQQALTEIIAIAQFRLAARISTTDDN